jgi:hypothetical protein
VRLLFGPTYFAEDLAFIAQAWLEGFKNFGFTGIFCIALLRRGTTSTLIR